MSGEIKNYESGPVAAILMASGFSRRFGLRNKLLVPFRGKALARYTLELAAGFDFQGGIFFICACDDVAALAADLSRVKVVKNSAPEKGMHESISLGLEAAGASPAYYLFFTCDQPFLYAFTVQRILDARQQGCIVEPRCKGKSGNPCLFSVSFRDELLSLGEGETPKLIKKRNSQALISVEVSNSIILEDIDDEETLERLELSNLV